jgi:hypothetical protein
MLEYFECAFHPLKYIIWSTSLKTKYFWLYNGRQGSISSQIWCFLHIHLYLWEKCFVKNGTMLYKVGNELMPNSPLKVVEFFWQLKKIGIFIKAKLCLEDGLKSHIIEEVQVLFIKNIYFKMKILWMILIPSLD